MNDFKAVWRESGDLVLRAVERVGASGWYILGGEVKAFEKSLSEFCNIKHVIGCASGLDAIEIALRCLGIATGDKVITTPLSAFATTLAVMRVGAIPVFVDVDDSGLIDLDLVQRELEKRNDIRFVLPVHLFGHSLDLDKLQHIKGRFDAKIIEDCAQSIGAKSRNKEAGSIGQISATSFYPTKNLGCIGDGGAVLTNSNEFAEKAKCIRDYGQSEKYVHDSFGLNSRLDELQAAILKDAFLPHLGQSNARRGAIAARYRAEIKNDNIKMPAIPDGSQSVWHLFPLLITTNRSDFQRHLSKLGVPSAIHYPKLISDQVALKNYTNFEISTPLEKAAFFADHVVSIPIHPYMSDNQIGQVIESCNIWR